MYGHGLANTWDIVPEATVAFVHGAGGFVVIVHEEGFVSATDHALFSFEGVSMMVVGCDAREWGLPWACHPLMVESWAKALNQSKKSGI